MPERTVACTTGAARAASCVLRQGFTFGKSTFCAPDSPRTLTAPRPFMGYGGSPFLTGTCEAGRGLVEGLYCVATLRFYYCVAKEALSEPARVSAGFSGFQQAVRLMPASAVRSPLLGV